MSKIVCGIIAHNRAPYAFDIALELHDELKHFIMLTAEFHSNYIFIIERAQKAHSSHLHSSLLCLTPQFLSRSAQ